jgi:RNA polymerase primary sigma factor
VTRLRTAAIRPASLDAPISDADHNTFGELIEDEAAVSPYRQLEDKTMNWMLHSVMEHLNGREATILKFRFGLDGNSERTLEEVGEKFGVTRERVRQIQNSALTKLRRLIEKMEAVQTTRF